MTKSKWIEAELKNHMGSVPKEHQAQARRAWLSGALKLLMVMDGQPALTREAMERELLALTKV